jgi:hypothetical protein
MAFLDLSLMLNRPFLLRRYISTYGTVDSLDVLDGCCKTVGIFQPDCSEFPLLE